MQACCSQRRALRQPARRCRCISQISAPRQRWWCCRRGGRLPRPAWSLEQDLLIAWRDTTACEAIGLREKAGGRVVEGYDGHHMRLIRCVPRVHSVPVCAQEIPKQRASYQSFGCHFRGDGTQDGEPLQNADWKGYRAIGTRSSQMASEKYGPWTGWNVKWEYLAFRHVLGWGRIARTQIWH